MASYRLSFKWCSCNPTHGTRVESAVSAYLHDLISIFAVYFYRSLYSTTPVQFVRSTELRSSINQLAHGVSMLGRFPRSVSASQHPYAWVCGCEMVSFRCTWLPLHPLRSSCRTSGFVCGRQRFFEHMLRNTSFTIAPIHLRPRPRTLSMLHVIALLFERCTSDVFRTHTSATATKKRHKNRL